MLKKLTYLLIALLPITATAQTFAPIGATWYYEDDWGITPYPGHHYLYESIADTTINAQPCRKIEVTHYASLINTLPPEYVFSDSNRIYYYRYNKFNLLFDFNAQQGDTIQVVDPSFSWSNPDTLSDIIIDSVRYLFDVLLDSTQFTGNDSLKVFFTSPQNPDSNLMFKAPIIENIGCTFWMFPLPLFTPPEENKSLRCYQDTSMSFKPYPNPCDYWIPTAIEENNPSQGSIEIYPNPFSKTATITLQGIDLPTTLTIYDNLGRAVRQEKITSLQHTIQRNNLSNGIYFYHINGQSRKLVLTGQKQ